MDVSHDYQLLYLIQLPNGNYSYVYTDEQGNFVPKINDEEIPYYVNDLDDFYDTSIREFWVGVSSFVGTFNSSWVNNSFNNLLI